MITFDLEREIVLIKLTGNLSISAIIEKERELLEHENHIPGMDEIWDFRDASVVLFNSSSLMALASTVSENLDRLARRTALVVASDLDYGIGRMWQAYSEYTAPQERRLFRDIEEAYKWLEG